mmetsp:Transcript_67922/g.153700  ORF Transcript_67922/g.153700 Transcript_67922/m.153700 type:complete len:296 (-) Transcript_67922:356-1243(-)
MQKIIASFALLCSCSEAFVPQSSLTQSRTRRAPLARPLPVTPKDAYDKALVLGTKKALLSPADTLLLGGAAGAHIAFGAFLMISGGGSCPGLAASNPGAQRILMGAFGLPMGLFMTIAGGGELVTGNFALVSTAFYEGKATLAQLLKNWSCAFTGNLIGSLLLAFLAFHAATLAGPASAAPIAIATKKCSLTFAEALCRGILCNWLVCMAVWTANAADDIGSKVLAIFFPITGFIALGLEHSVANMFIIPYGMMMGASITVNQFILGNLLPVTLGNIIGGAVAVGATYRKAYGSN